MPQQKRNRSRWLQQAGAAGGNRIATDLKALLRNDDIQFVIVQVRKQHGNAVKKMADKILRYQGT
jgi:predicted dehydrogenase